MELKDFQGEVRLKEPMRNHTSFRIGGPADIFAVPLDRQDLCLLIRAAAASKLPVFILGAGTNLLVRDGGVRGVVISMERISGIEEERRYRSIGGTYCVVRAEAGALLPRLLGFALQRGFSGIEFAAGIPGTVGGAICMNAGTSKGEISDVIDSVTMISPSGEEVTKSREEMEFGYRRANIPAGHVVVETRLILRLDNPEKINARVQDILKRRQQTQPLNLPNAGSIFKNPLDEAAGRLIEKAGLKGVAIGNAEVSKRHANFIVNKGDAKASDVIKLMEVVQSRVLEVHGVKLEPEIKIIGEDD